MLHNTSASTHFDAGDPKAADPIDRVGSRPDFAILAYPVISFTTEYVHKGSRENLLGRDPDPKLVEYLSSEKQVTRETPPTFLFHTDEDVTVPPENSVLYYLALRKAGVPAEMHMFQRGPHGVGLAATDQTLVVWQQVLANWLRTRSWEKTR
jgi:dipeptidyl aminopeptidase/acylaminoacyl peptidase